MPERQPRRFEDFEPDLTPAEQKVLDELDTGETIVIGTHVPDADAAEDRLIRARFLRWVILGCEGSESHKVHEKGVRIKGAFIAGEGYGRIAGPVLDLQGCQIAHDVFLVDCCFIEAPRLFHARMQRLVLNRSYLPGLHADGLQSRGDIALRAIVCDGEIRFAAATIGGTFDCDNAVIRNPDRCTLAADGLKTKGAVFLRHAASTGEIRLLNAQLGDDLDCDNANFMNPRGVALHADGATTRGNVFFRWMESRGEVRLPGVKAGGNLECDGAKLHNPDGPALSASGMQIKGILYWRAGVVAEGTVDLTAAEIDTLHDDPDCWPDHGALSLDRCVYGAFTGLGISGHARKDWLARQDKPQSASEFRPQPYEQCAQVLRAMGHVEDARVVLVEKERRLRQARRRRIGGWLARGMAARDWFLGQLVRYGHKPLRAAWYFLALWIVGTAVFWHVYQTDAFKPNSTSVLAGSAWSNCSKQAPANAYLGRPGEAQLRCYLRQPSAQSYPAFNAGVYVLDVLAPVVQLEQHKYWIPDEDQPLGYWGKALVYFQIVAGWLLSLLAVAGLSGIIKSD